MTQSTLATWLLPARKDIVRLKKQQLLTHALLLIGKDGGGQHQLASFSGQDILCDDLQDVGACGKCHACHLVVANTHPDFHLLDGREEIIKVDQIREVLKKVATKPQIGKAKVVFLAQASSMNINAANAILKALEEPPQETFFILTADANSRLLATIRSRCMLMTLPTPSHKETQEWLSHLDAEEPLSELFWVTQEPFTLASLALSGKSDIYNRLPNALYDFLQNKSSVEDVLGKLDNKNSIEFIKALLAIFHHCICYSTGESVPNLDKLQSCFDLLLNQKGIHKIIQCFQRLQHLSDNSNKTHLNMLMQLKAELIFLTD